MPTSLSPRSRRLLNSIAYSALVALVTVLGYLTFRAVSERRHSVAGNSEAAAEPESTPLFDIANFAARQERSADAERLTVSLRVRLTKPGSVDAYVYVLARNDHVVPRLWAVWPTQGPGGVVTAGGHLRTQNPASGEAVKLSPSWTRITATLDHPPGRPPFDTVYVYLVNPDGEILLARPFAL
ncbi:MAG TPA: hypothetical protein VMW56_13570 [Candidatus Margulisiibacteriota bacterium]|nr:hypothetical protein [Candidatus Margulisiibacteriota bacterium]